jgi:hypothetical protein
VLVRSQAEKAALVAKYNTLYEPFYTKRADIVRDLYGTKHKQ